jgi:hypothetical protein
MYRNQSRNNRRQNTSRRNYKGGINCPENQYQFNTACVETCPPGTYAEPGQLKCSSDTFLNRSATKLRLVGDKAKAAAKAGLSKAASVTKAAAISAASATKAGLSKAASATSAWASNKKAQAAAKVYQGCKGYVSEYETALSTGKDVTTIPPPSSEDELLPNPGQLGGRYNSYRSAVQLLRRHQQ